MAAAVVHRLQPQREQAGKIDAGEAAQRGPADEPAEILLGRGGDERRQGLCHALGDQCRVLRSGEPAGRHSRQVSMAKPGGNGGWLQEMLLDEARQPAGDALLVVGDDAGMRNGEAQRPAEQRGDGEPVGNTAGNAGFRNPARQQRPEVRLRIEKGGSEQRHRHEQQAGGDQPLPGGVAIVGIGG